MGGEIGEGEEREKGRGGETYVRDFVLVGAVEEWVENVDARFGLEGYAG